MSDRPIIFSAPMVRALLDGRKTQTRRILKLPKWASADPIHIEFGSSGEPEVICRDTGCLVALPLPYAAGDRLYVREAHALLPLTAYRGSIGTGTIEQREHPTDGYTAAVFREGFDRSGRPLWRPSIHMPRWASRLTLVVTEVRVQRLQDISEADAIDEGALTVDFPTHGAPTERGKPPIGQGPRARFEHLWNSINGPEAWAANPWVAAVGFTVHRANIDALDIGAAA